MLKLLRIPLFAVVFGLLIAAYFRLTRMRLVLVIVVLWIICAVYEYLMQIPRAV